MISDNKWFCTVSLDSQASYMSVAPSLRPRIHVNISEAPTARVHINISEASPEQLTQVDIAGIWTQST